MQKKNIIHVTSSNALSLYLISIAKLYDKDKYNLIIGCFDELGPLNEELNKLHIPNFNIPITKNYQYLFRFLKLYRLLKKNNTDILHLHTFYPSLFGIFAAKLAGTKKIVVTRHHADYHIIKNKKFHSYLDGWTARHCDVMIAVSEWTKKVMIDHEHVDEKKINVILNGIDPLVTDSTKNKEWLRKEFAVAPDSLILTCVSRLFPEKI
ncbi:MAG: glycosyltransferase [Sphingobacteriaceae bacterium]|nr:glycosyltransferase [Sphingobacteriaceae bacterium]